MYKQGLINNESLLSSKNKKNTEIYSTIILCIKYCLCNKFPVYVYIIINILYIYKCFSIKKLTQKYCSTMHRFIYYFGFEIS